jgi:hypothetical protein
MTVAAPADDASTASALAFVQGIYKQYGRHDSNAHPLDDDSGIRRYFEPSLAAAVIKDRADAAKRGEAGNLDFDPFIYGNDDWDMSDLDIAVSDAGPDKATATVKFTVDKRPTTVFLDLVKIKNDWRVSEIVWPDATAGNLHSLRGQANYAAGRGGGQEAALGTNKSRTFVRMSNSTLVRMTGPV